MSLVLVPYLPEYINANRKVPRIAKEMSDKVQDAVTVARELGDDNIPVSIVGLGGFTSIITQNAQSINDYEVPVTTGNAYTTGLAIQGILYAAEKRNLDIEQAKLAIVGAAGNIGSVLGQILLPRVKHLVLIGSPKSGSEGRLNKSRQLCLYELLCSIQSEQQAGINIEGTRIKGEGFRIYSFIQSGQSDAIQEIKTALASGTISAAHAQTLDSILFEENSGFKIDVATSIKESYDCDIVILSTNSEDPDLIKPEFYKPDAILCCVSLPSNLSKNFSKDVSQLAFDGSLARLPENSEINFVGMPKKGLAYGCLSETLVLAFEGHNHSYSKGELLTRQVYEIMEKAVINGFDLGSLKFNDKVLLHREPN